MPVLRQAKSPLTRLLPFSVALLLLLSQTGCQACWSAYDSSYCGSSIDMCGDGDAALFLGALYLALAIPYLIGAAYRSCQ